MQRRADLRPPPSRPLRADQQRACSLENPPPAEGATSHLHGAAGTRIARNRLTGSGYRVIISIDLVEKPPQAVACQEDRILI